MENKSSLSSEPNVQGGGEQELLLDGLKSCPCCGWVAPMVTCSPHCFPEPGWQLRCDKCGLQTCWWHSKEEAFTAWNARFQPNQAAHAEVAALIDRLETIDDTVARGPWEASQPDHFPHKIKIDGFEFDCPAGSAQVRADESDIPTGCLIPHGIIHYDDAEGIAEMRNLIQPVIKVLRSISAPSAPADMKRLAREAAEKIRSIGFIDIQASERPTDTLATIIESVLTGAQKKEEGNNEG
jgi:hypothetical protein